MCVFATGIIFFAMSMVVFTSTHLFVTSVYSSKLHAPFEVTVESLQTQMTMKFAKYSPVIQNACKSYFSKRLASRLLLESLSVESNFLKNNTSRIKARIPVSPPLQCTVHSPDHMKRFDNAFAYLSFHESMSMNNGTLIFNFLTPANEYFDENEVVIISVHDDDKSKNVTHVQSETQIKNKQNIVFQAKKTRREIEALENEMTTNLCQKRFLCVLRDHQLVSPSSNSKRLEPLIFFSKPIESQCQSLSPSSMSPVIVYCDMLDEWTLAYYSHHHHAGNDDDVNDYLLSYLNQVQHYSNAILQSGEETRVTLELFDIRPVEYLQQLGLSNININANTNKWLFWSSGAVRPVCSTFLVNQKQLHRHDPPLWLPSTNTLWNTHATAAAKRQAQTPTPSRKYLISACVMVHPIHKRNRQLSQLLLNWIEFHHWIGSCLFLVAKKNFILFLFSLLYIYIHTYIFYYYLFIFIFILTKYNLFIYFFFV
ncbi:hypothetical protein RFI_31183 [Reticulomyxa filosa]|uniref:Uncharacterized protein n=1 Tax=Reticulomyxa filosa TaxID=46433 RepID=X6LX55_RETFI|nr:hypothetical protein RFI_31183 [Reticulomyxa filosa]|eukprot:ETO06209.1 hypothetical protein RFI_31183 [Reticulomyxa filosa]